MLTYTVSRLNITGELCFNTTPIEVIIQCMSSHGFEVQDDLMLEPRYRKKCVDKFNNISPLLVKDLRKAARYVNRTEIFTDVNELIKSMDFLHKAEKIHFSETKQLIENYPIGAITNKTLLSLDCTILYRLVRQKGFVTKPEYTTMDLYNILVTDVYVPTRRIQDFMIDLIGFMDKREILEKFFPVMKNYVNDFKFPMGELYECFLSKTNTSLIDPLGLRFPKTDTESILIAAKKYKIDISESQQPLMEFAILFKYGAKDRSFPVDSTLQERVGKDPLSLNLDQRFNPKLPEEVYGPEDLTKMAIEEGWTTSNQTLTPYQFLLTVYNCDTFFAYSKGPMSGVQPSNDTLLIDIEPVSCQDPANLVLYGSRNAISEIKALTWNELILTFENYREFRNPTSTTGIVILEDYCINKLIILARKPCIDRIVSDRRKRLMTVIESIFVERNQRMKYLNSIKGTLTSNPEWNAGFQGLFEYLYKMSLTMRSLKETDNIPETGGLGHLDHEETQLNVSMAAVSFHLQLDKTNEWVRDTFLNLPLVIYYPRENKFSTSDTSFEGYTIGGRLNIIHSGETTTAISSCLRLSSNWFLSTIYYYQTIFNFPVRFDITRLKHTG
jgi:hypothetical protein